METSGTISAILNNKGNEVLSISPDAYVYDAIKLMSEANVGALIVTVGGKPCGIVSERDYTRRIILKGKSSKETQVKEIMTGELITVDPGYSIEKCMQLVTEYHIRHLPVVHDDKLIGIVSIGDLVRWTISAQNATIDQLKDYITGQYPG